MGNGRTVSVDALEQGLSDGERAVLAMALNGAHTDGRGNANAAEVEELVAGTRAGPAVLAALDPDAVEGDDLDGRY